MTLTSLMIVLLLLAVATLVLRRPSNRFLRRCHLKLVDLASYDQMVDLALISCQCLALGFLVHQTGQIALGSWSYDWHFLVFLLLYLVALVEMTLLLLILFVDGCLQTDSRLLFQKMRWLSFDRNHPSLSIFLILLATIGDFVLYIVFLRGTLAHNMTGMGIVILLYAMSKAVYFRGGVAKVLAVMLFSVIGLWVLTAAVLYGELSAIILLLVTYTFISVKE
ncbi:SagF family protein [Streptococcus phocae subsp. salmonis]|uniref:SagF family protein n=1 Tax=Streptococcus phocae TaxID=119224 RepID=UPI0005313F98|nr:SagF family protein [Streptococcus phocae]KGR72226.1 hypothetical protein NX86_07375 [Streptococcus phocae subsp. salmonis]